MHVHTFMSYCHVLMHLHIHVHVHNPKHKHTYIYYIYTYCTLHTPCTHIHTYHTHTHTHAHTHTHTHTHTQGLGGELTAVRQEVGREREKVRELEMAVSDKEDQVHIVEKKSQGIVRNMSIPYSTFLNLANFALRIFKQIYSK